MRLKEIQKYVFRLSRSVEAIWNHPLTQKKQMGSVAALLYFPHTWAVITGTDFIPICWPYLFFSASGNGWHCREYLHGIGRF